ncbi:CC0125/CC1285 family lipoprotein [Shewanella sp. HL-SH8]|jgi:hypothetical protein|uniref:CC0125/CC1285 family lipoprotein n=1 Tax=Shewanella sp. HL-SH8 TaxID=3436242 RepID=UPI003EBDF0C4
MKYLIQIILVINLLMLGGCASPTTYQSQGLTGGYSDSKYEDKENTYYVRFSGNGNTSQRRANDFALLRAAVLARKNLSPYFEVIYLKNVINQGSSGTAGVYTFKPEVVIEVKLINEFNNKVDTFDTEKLISQLTTQYLIDESTLQ